MPETRAAKAARLAAAHLSGDGPSARDVYAALARLRRLRRLRRLHMGTYDGLQHIRLLAEPLPAAAAAAAAEPMTPAVAPPPL
ncbi:hypothetical protein CHLRE_07g345524v5 [Chlamydomonas reinhardtii]|uniref:Uncharacterized protein n=1 Tax=Chlamydomonas reinhardtii TaxID=3055 RepID=A0A2K3DKW6_CHLRE|nr:uncharacterized protein CHLRE_07g345524v5 [Chlamydomonas reinhardtii]PNW81179.1 hypothetical protein CHLRE_07g345524v5 [Chlamydomonas reinhardtii]